ncbi:11532_t:CDS:1, partial [Funneliformis caledonium]
DERALETLQGIQEKRDVRKAKVNYLINDLRVGLRDRYREAFQYSPSYSTGILSQKFIPGTNKYP